MSPTTEINKFVIVDLNYQNVNEMADVANIYACVPKNWNSNYHVAAEMPAKYQQWLSEKKDNLKCLLVKDEATIIGLHILEMTKLAPDACCSIKTLWVHEDYRKKGIASSLKIAGETWALQIGAKMLMTFVMADNPLMLMINKKNGFLPTRLEMRKDLK